MTQATSFSDEAYRTGACKLNTVETEKKHVLFLFNDKNQEVGRYYLGKKLQGKSQKELVQIVGSLCLFESWNPKSESGVPCFGLSSDDSNKNKLEMTLHVLEVDLNAKGKFKNIAEEMWIIVDKNIITPYGPLLVNDALYVKNLFY